MAPLIVEDREIRREIRWLTIPIIVESFFALSGTMIFLAFLNRIDSVGLSSLTHVSAYGLSTLITGIFWNLTKGLGVGATIAVSRAYGAGDSERMRRLAAQTAELLFALGLVFGALLFLFAEPIMGFYRPDAETLKLSVDYLRICSFGFPFLGLLHATTGTLQGLGDTKTPMRISLILNIIFLIIGVPLVMGWITSPIGVIGGAYALTAGQAVTGLIGMAALFSRRGRMPGCVRQGYFRPRLGDCADVLKLGLPTSMENIFWLAGAMVLGRVMLGFGSLDYAANQVGMQTEAIATLPATSFGIVATTLCGRAIGARNNKLGANYMKTVRLTSLPVIAVGLLLLLALPVPLLRLMTDNRDVIRLASVYLRLMGLSLVQHALTQVYFGALKASGHTRTPMIIALLGVWAIRIPLSILAASIEGSTIVWLWVIMVLDLNFRFFAAIWMYKRKKILREDADGGGQDGCSHVGGAGVPAPETADSAGVEQRPVSAEDLPPVDGAAEPDVVFSPDPIAVPAVITDEARLPRRDDFAATAEDESRAPEKEAGRPTSDED